MTNAHTGKNPTYVNFFGDNHQALLVSCTSQLIKLKTTIYKVLGKTFRSEFNVAAAAAAVCTASGLHLYAARIHYKMLLFSGQNPAYAPGL